MIRRENGTFTPKPPRPEPPSVLLEHLRFVARGVVRPVYNDPRTTVHVERMVLHWLLNWDPIADPPIRAYIALKAGNEARRIKAMKPAKQTEAFARSHDLERVTLRDRYPNRANRPSTRTLGRPSTK